LLFSLRFGKGKSAHRGIGSSASRTFQLVGGRDIEIVDRFVVVGNVFDGNLGDGDDIARCCGAFTW
jgi:hypothetical protein